MSRSEDLEPFSDSLQAVFARLGLPDPVVISRLVDEWDALAGSPWVGRSRPLYVRGRTLVVEASSPSMIAFLRYGCQTLVQTLEGRFGPGFIEQVELVGPGGR